MMEGWLNMARLRLAGETPEEKLENLMAELSYLPADILEILRPELAADLGVELPKGDTGKE
jgi:hypothetical protein